MNLIQLLTDQQAYEGITHCWWGASWNWRWRKVGDDEDRRFPSPEPQTGSRSGLPMKNGRWRRLRIVKRDETSSLFFLGESEFIALELGQTAACGPHKASGHALGGSRPVALWATGGPSSVDSCANNFYLFHKKTPKSFIQFREL